LLKAKITRLKNITILRYIFSEIDDQKYFQLIFKTYQNFYFRNLQFTSISIFENDLKICPA